MPYPVAKLPILQALLPPSFWLICFLANKANKELLADIIKYDLNIVVLYGTKNLEHHNN
jgi:hypothetical protein